MLTKVQKWGNSQGFRVSKELLAELQIALGDTVELSARDGAIVATPIHRKLGQYDLRGLVKHIPKSCVMKELNWGCPKGKEVW